MQKLECLSETGDRCRSVMRHAGVAHQCALFEGSNKEPDKILIDISSDWRFAILVEMVYTVHTVQYYDKCLLSVRYFTTYKVGYRSKGHQHRSSIRYKKRDATNDPAAATMRARKRGILPRSRITVSQKDTVFLMLIGKISGNVFKRGALMKCHLIVRRTRLFNMSYTPSRKTSFWRRRTGPSSGSIQGHPLVAGSGSVAARNTAPAMR